MLKNLRVIVIFLTVSFIFQNTACSITLEQGKQAFQKYVKCSNDCSVALIGMYDKNSLIKRVVQNPDGSSYTKILPIGMYKTMLIGYSKAALLQGYSNIYTNVSFYQSGEDVVVKALRHPSTSKERLPATIIFGKNNSGKIIVKEEIFNTNASFLLK